MPRAMTSRSILANQISNLVEPRRIRRREVKLHPRMACEEIVSRGYLAEVSGNRVIDRNVLAVWASGVANNPLGSTEIIGTTPSDDTCTPPPAPVNDPTMIVRLDGIDGTGFCVIVT